MSADNDRDRPTFPRRVELATENMRPLVAQVAAVAPERPTLAGRYELQALLGHGGMADVYLARDVRLERMVAVKLLRAELASDAEHVERFRREALMLAMLECAYVVPIYDVVLTEARPFFVMRYVAGRTLDQELMTSGRMSPRRAASVLLRVLYGLRELHAHRIVHRDLKLSNVLLGDDSTIVLLDLGVALDRRRPMLTRPGFVAGTPESMAPEQAAGDRVDERVDLYQAGVMLAQLITGLQDPDLSTLSGIPLDLARVITAATAPVAERYLSANAMAIGLRAVARRLGDCAP